MTRDEAIQELTAVTRVGKATGGRLYDAGVETVAELAALTEQEIVDKGDVSLTAAAVIKASAMELAPHDATTDDDDTATPADPSWADEVDSMTPAATGPKVDVLTDGDVGPHSGSPKPNVRTLPEIASPTPREPVEVPMEIKLLMLKRPLRPYQQKPSPYHGILWDCRVCIECFEFRTFPNREIMRKRLAYEPFEHGSAHYYGECVCDKRGTWGMSMSYKPRGLDEKIASCKGNDRLFAEFYEWVNEKLEDPDKHTRQSVKIMENEMKQRAEKRKAAEAAKRR